jgi:hypothetical protein
LFWIAEPPVGGIVTTLTKGEDGRKGKQNQEQVIVHFPEAASNHIAYFLVWFKRETQG